MQLYRDIVPFVFATLHGFSLRGTEHDNTDVCTSFMEKGLYETLHYGTIIVEVGARYKFYW